MVGLTRRTLVNGCGVLLAGTVAPALAQGTPPWVVPDLLEKAKAEGGLTIYSSMNEQEGLPLWKLFEQATGISVAYIRASDTQLLSRIAIEGRARQRSWDLLVSTAAVKVPAEGAAQFDLPEAKNIMPEARDKNRRWYGVYAHYNAPAYNTKLIQKSELPTSFEDFATKTQWKGKVAIDSADSQWLWAMYSHFGEEKARKVIGDLITNLDVVPIDGHLQVARAVASGEYLFALNNYVALTLNMHLSGAATDYFSLDPVPLFFGAVAVSAQAPHPNAARLAANFLLSEQAQDLSRKAGRLPTRLDVAPNPPDAITRLTAHKVVPVNFEAADEKIWQKKFQDLFRRR
jgi:iron(III) transport system substrate-binding protein